MSQEIRVGDLVEIAYPTKCCRNTETCGIFFIISEIRNDVTLECFYCNKLYKPPSKSTFGKSDGCPTFFDRLRRIPPLSEFEDTKETNEVTA